jgi:homoserine dehydrogenase
MAGFSPQRLIELSRLKSAGQPLVEALGGRAATALDAVREISGASLVRPILVDATPADTTDVLELALSRGFDVVLANKVPLAASQDSVDRLRAIADRAGRTILHEATVGAGLPVIDTLRKLLEAGDDVVSIEGCPSGTLASSSASLVVANGFRSRCGAPSSTGTPSPIHESISADWTSRERR